ncbi:MAG: exopolysaccharide biosynthesis protein [Chloroflexota bacterium]|nr:exopolysaccharide biosynthesis protein [Chloroflexota bacterium]
MAVEFQDSDKPLSQTLNDMAATITGDHVTVRELMARVGEQGLLLFCMFLTIPFLVPISIPGVSTVFGAVIILIALGITVNRIPWLPRPLMERPIAAAGLREAMARGSKMMERLDRIVKPRLNHLTTGAVMNRVNGLVLLLGGILLIFPLGLIPFSNTLPGWGILFLAAGILQRDGVAILIGYLFMVATIIYFIILALGALAMGSGIMSLVGAG